MRYIISQAQFIRSKSIVQYNVQTVRDAWLQSVSRQELFHHSNITDQFCIIFKTTKWMNGKL